MAATFTSGNAGSYSVLSRLNKTGTGTASATISAGAAEPTPNSLAIKGSSAGSLFFSTTCVIQDRKTVTPPLPESESKPRSINPNKTVTQDNGYVAPPQHDWETQPRPARSTASDIQDNKNVYSQRPSAAKRRPARRDGPTKMKPRGTAQPYYVAPPLRAAAPPSPSGSGNSGRSQHFVAEAPRPDSPPLQSFASAIPAETLDDFMFMVISAQNYQVVSEAMQSWIYE